MNYTESSIRRVPLNLISVIGTGHYNTLMDIMEGDTDAAVTGSLGLYLLGIIDREPGDIDILTNRRMSMTIPMKAHSATAMHLGDYDEITHGNPPKELHRDKSTSYIGTLYEIHNGGEYIVVDKFVCEEIVTVLKGKGIRIAAPEHAILAKLNFVEYFSNKKFLTTLQANKVLKHKQDIEAYYKKELRVDLALPLKFRKSYSGWFHEKGHATLTIDKPKIKKLKNELETRLRKRRYGTIRDQETPILLRYRKH